MKDFVGAEVKKLVTIEKSVAEMLEYYAFRHSVFLCYSGDGIRIEWTEEGI